MQVAVPQWDLFDVELLEPGAEPGGEERRALQAPAHHSDRVVVVSFILISAVCTVFRPTKVGPVSFIMCSGKLLISSTASSWGEGRQTGWM